MADSSPPRRSEGEPSPTLWRWPAVGALAAAVALAAGLRLVPGPHITDDAYITYTYVRNLTSGLGFVYNPGERVLGTTTPLYTLLLSGLYIALGRFGASIRGISYALNALLDAGSAVLIAWLGLRLTGSRAVAVGCAALWAASSVAIAVSLSGMETPLYVLLILTTLALLFTGRAVAAALTCALAALTRPDALLLAAVAAAHLGIARWKRLPGALGVGLLTVAPWLVFSARYFGSPIATSVVAKNVVYIIPPGEAFRHFARHAAALVGLDLHGPRAALAAAGLGAIWLLGIWRAARRSRDALTIGSFAALYVAVFGLANRPMFRWYFVPLEPLYLVGLGAALHWFAGGARRAPAWLPRGLAAAAAAAALAGQLWSLNLIPDDARAWLAPKRISMEREQLYARVAQELNESYALHPGVTVATPEIGAFGYWSEARILDTTGLVSPQAITYYPIDASLSPECNYAIAPRMIRDLRPELVVSLEVFIRHSLLLDPWFEANYVPSARYPTDAFGSKGLLVYRRSDWRPGAAAPGRAEIRGGARPRQAAPA